MSRLAALIQLFLKSWNESYLKVELNLCKLVTAACARILCQDYPRIILALFPELVDYVVDEWGRSGESSARGDHLGDMVSRWGKQSLRTAFYYFPNANMAILFIFKKDGPVGMPRFQKFLLDY